nr:MAG TPA: adenine-specific methyltransferase [Caudoviricetes sp.]
MDSLLASRISGGNTAYRRAVSDFYPTPPEATRALLDFLQLPLKTMIWEPACGQGHMVNVMREYGFQVVDTDIQTGADFLEAVMPDGVEWIITNPPFSQADAFIKRCVLHGKPFALLLKSQYWHAKKRLSLFRENPPAYLLPLTWRPDFLFGQRGSGSPLMDVMWCVWNSLEAVTRYIPLERPVAAAQREGGKHDGD